MKQAKPILIFLGKFLLIFVALAALYHLVLDKPYTRILGKNIEAFYDGSFGKNGTRDVQLPGLENKKNDQIRIFMMDEDMTNKYRQQAAQARQRNEKMLPFKPPLIEIDTWVHAGLYLVFFIALVLASALNWKRALIAILAGLVILHLFFILKTGLRIHFEAFSGNLGGVSVSSFGKGFFGFLNNLFRLVGGNLLIVLLLWLLIAFGRNDYDRLLQKLLPTE